MQLGNYLTGNLNKFDDVLCSDLEPRPLCLYDEVEHCVSLTILYFRSKHKHIITCNLVLYSSSFWS